MPVCDRVSGGTVLIANDWRNSQPISGHTIPYVCVAEQYERRENKMRSIMGRDDVFVSFCSSLWMWSGLLQVLALTSPHLAKWAPFLLSCLFSGYFYCGNSNKTRAWDFYYCRWPCVDGEVRIISLPWFCRLLTVLDQSTKSPFPVCYTVID